MKKLVHLAPPFPLISMQRSTCFPLVRSHPPCLSPSPKPTRGRLITHNSILRLVCTHIPKLVLVSNSLLFRCFNLCPGNSPAIPPASPPASFTLIRHQYERTLITAPANSELSPLSNADSLPLFLPHPIPSHPILPVFPMPMITPLSCHSNRCAPVHVLVFDNIKI